MRGHRRVVLFVAVMVLALGVRLVGIDWGHGHEVEEAVPLKKAWSMWGWGDGHLDLDPHFFHYPTLTFYVQFAGQAALYAAMRTSGAVNSSRDFRIRYYTAPEPFYLTGRMIAVLFALLTVALVWRLASRSGALYAAPAAAVLVALNVFHITRSQMVEVDVALAALCTLALVAMAAMVASPSRWRYVFAGIAVGLAASAKYTGAILVVPLLVAHLFARRRAPATASWGGLAAALALAAAAFALTSPYVLLDFHAFRADLVLERTHMRLGHFGGGHEAAWRFYAGRLGSTLAGWPMLVFAAVGMWISALWRRRGWAVVSAAFVFAYAASICTWAVHTDRYALPLLPVLAVFAAVGLSWSIERFVPARARAVAAVAGVVVMLLPMAPQVQAHLERMKTDSRDIALEWIERNVPPGSLVVTEPYGPPLFTPVEFWSLDADIRRDVYKQRTARGFRGVLPIPLFQAEPEKTAPYYDLDLYREADVVITTGAVRSRYEADPGRFAAQVAFYHALDRDFELVDLVDASGAGSRISIYTNPEHVRPFAGRAVTVPAPFTAPSLPPQWRAWFDYRLGLNFEAFGHLHPALEIYRRAWPDAVTESETYRQVAYGIVRTLRLLDRTAEVPGVIEQLTANAPTPRDRAFVESLDTSRLSR